MCCAGRKLNHLKPSRLHKRCAPNSSQSCDPGRRSVGTRGVLSVSGLGLRTPISRMPHVHERTRVRALRVIPTQQLQLFE